MWEGSRVLDAHVTAPGGVHVARSDDDDRASESHTCVFGTVEGCSSARSLVGVTIMYLRSSVHFICRWPFSPASCTSCRCLTLPSCFWRPAPQPLVTFCARFPRLPLLGRCRRRACRPRASVARYLCARSPRLPPLGRCRRRACRPRASVVGYLLSPLPSLAICWSPPPSRLSPLRLSWRLPFEPVPLVCHL